MIYNDTRESELGYAVGLQHKQPYTETADVLTKALCSVLPTALAALK